MFFLRRLFKPKYIKNERRRSERVEARDLVKIDFQTIGLRRMSGLGSGKDISMSGLRFATFAPLKKGESLDASLHFFKLFPGQKRIPLQMTVVRVYKPMGSRRYRVGVQFVQTPRYKPEFEILAQFIAWLKTQEE